MEKKHPKKKIAIIGGGIAGSGIAMYLSQFDVEIELFEQGSSLVNGPPICHLHAGGNLYREISNEQCLTLLKESIETTQFFPGALNERPTVIAVPLSDNGDPTELLPRLTLLQDTYSDLIKQNKKNEVFGRAESYFKVFNRAELEVIAQKVPLPNPVDIDDWMIPFSRQVDLEQIKYPVILVQEYGLSVFRMAAIAQLSLNNQANVTIHLNSSVNGVKKHSTPNLRWCLSYEEADKSTKVDEGFDYVINSAGFKTGMIDDLAKKPTDRLIEFKAAYVTQWKNDFIGKWPEVIFHGERGTPQGMAQLTPYPNGYFQLHGMTEEITLFKGGLSQSNSNSSQPVLPEKLIKKITTGWDSSIQHQRTVNAIDHLGQFIPEFYQAAPAGKPLYGAQQIPGMDATLRAANISFTEDGYFRAEIVKASSAIECAKEIERIIGLGEVKYLLEKVPNDEVISLAEKLAKYRGYPIELAQVY